MAVVEVAWDVKTTSDLTDLARRNRASEEMHFKKELVGMNVVLSLKGEGVFRWDLEGGHLSDYEFSSAEDIDSSVRSKTGEAGEMREEILEMGGRVIVSGKVERWET